jgi:hypothetical protein
VNTPPRIALTDEGGGRVAACECGWLRWFPAKGDAAETGQAHAAKCKGAPEKPARVAPKRAAAKWDEREGSTWIDKL